MFSHGKRYFLCVICNRVFKAPFSGSHHGKPMKFLKDTEASKILKAMNRKK